MSRATTPGHEGIARRDRYRLPGRETVSARAPAPMPAGNRDGGQCASATAELVRRPFAAQMQQAPGRSRPTSRAKRRLPSRGREVSADSHLVAYLHNARSGLVLTTWYRPRCNPIPRPTREKRLSSRWSGMEPVRLSRFSVPMLRAVDMDVTSPAHGPPGSLGGQASLPRCSYPCP